MKQKCKNKVKSLLSRKGLVALLACSGTLFFVPQQATYAASSTSYEIEERNQQTITIRGKVVDDFGDPLPGATVRPKGEKTGTTTDMDGNFSLTVSSKNSVLLISFIGFTPKEVKAGDNLSRIVL
ncbi:MAG: carboxypeptidase-like regulatory domain-containing protein, partial [Bacteroides sp.]